jgi:hypothetical protein
MRDMVGWAKSSPGLRHLANQIVYACPGKAWECQMAALFTWVRKNIRYTLDTNDWEVIQRADVTVKLRYGDCDDFCILLASLLEQVGFSTAYCALGFGEPGIYSHVIVLAELQGETDVIAMDATEPDPMGWFPPGATCAMICPNSAGSSFASWQGGGGIG